MRFPPQKKMIMQKVPIKGKNRNRRENPKKDQLRRRDKEIKDTESITPIEKEKEEEPEIREFEEVSCELVKEDDFSGDYMNGDISLHLSASDQDLYFFGKHRYKIRGMGRD